MDENGEREHEEEHGLGPEHAETQHEENPGPDPYQPDDSPSSPGSTTHTEEDEETVITCTEFISLHSCKYY